MHKEEQTSSSDESLSRQRQHELRLEQAQMTKHKQRHKNLRNNAARSIPYWLGNNPECLELTMGYLNISVTPNGNQNTSSVLSEYRQMYLDSIPSFFQKLTGQPTDEFKTALDALVDVGFGDLQWAKNHRKRLEHQANFHKFSKLLTKKTAKLADRREKLERQRKKLLELEQSHPKHEATEEKSAKELAPKSLLQRTVETLSSFLVSPSQNMKEVAATETQEDVQANKDFVQRLERQRRQVQQAEVSVATTQQQIESVQTQRDSFRPVLTDAEYERANAVVKEVLNEICKALAEHIRQRHSRLLEQYQMLDSNTDLTKPHEWYMHARLDRRKIIFHAGPTNSGKTYTALERLKTAKKGLYLGPLRLLAAEIYETLTSQGVYTNLYTGQEKRVIPFATHSAATVEMAFTDDEFDVVVIDEIQMIADKFRGFAWTRALLGLRCKEIHVCGGLEARDIVERIAGFCGDEFEIRKYERFGALNVANSSLAPSSTALGTYKAVQPGDCVVAFSRNDIFAIKREIETSTPYKCCVIYGSLPPETRTDQARRFNDPDSEYDILVASDAIGMGLNLNIKRIIFNSMFKSNGEAIVQLDHSSVKQISGRAGRRNSPFPNGEVTCRDPEDMKHLRQCMSKEIAPIRKAGLLPTGAHIELFNETLKTYELGKEYDKLHRILEQFSDMAKVKGDFFLCRQTPMRVIAKWLSDLNLPIKDKYTMCIGPVTTNCERSMTTLKKFAHKLSVGEAAGLTRSMTPKPAKKFEDLSQLCSVHSELELFLWLSNRFPGNIVEQQAALALKEQAIAYINKGLGESETLKLDHCYLRRDARLRETWRKKLRDKDLIEEFLPNEEVDDV